MTANPSGMHDCWLRVRNDRGGWDDRASYLADDEAEAMAMAREIAPTGEIRVWYGEHRITSPRAAAKQPSADNGSLATPSVRP